MTEFITGLLLGALFTFSLLEYRKWRDLLTSHTNKTTH